MPTDEIDRPCQDCAGLVASIYRYRNGTKAKQAHLCINCVRARVSRTLAWDAQMEAAP